jgi:CheY-like chemotaxis protein
MSDQTDRRLCVLIVDDDELMRAVLRKVLERKGFDVVDAENGIRALRLFDTQGVDVVVTDIFMPDEDGLELIQDLLRRKPKLPIVAISGGGSHHVTSLLTVASALGAGAVLPKPFRSSDLIAALQGVLDRAA